MSGLHSRTIDSAKPTNKKENQMTDPITAARIAYALADKAFRLNPTDANLASYEITRKAFLAAEAEAGLSSNAAVDDDEDQDERPFPDSDEAIRALQDVAESVDELEAECHRLRDENKLLRAERVEAERTILRLESQYGVAVKDRDEARKTCCRLWQKEDSGYITVQRLAEDQGWDCFTTNDPNA
jgi:hypothetical protein